MGVGEMLRRPQRAMGDAGMENSEIGKTKLARLHGELGVGEDRCLAVRAELRAACRSMGVCRDCEEYTGEKFAH